MIAVKTFNEYCLNQLSNQNVESVAEARCDWVILGEVTDH